ncbi:hypothetical protein Tco_0537693, partial [Tanacetum coccineum]
VGDKVMLKVSPWKGVVRFGKRGKLNPRYVGPFKVLEKPSNLILEKWVDCQLGSLTAGVIVEKGRDDCPWGCLGLQDKGEEGDP